MSLRIPHLPVWCALCLSTLGITALPHADLNEHAFHESWASASLLLLAVPHLFGLGLGMLAGAGMTRLDWARVREINPWWWLAAAVLVMLLPFAWRGLTDDRLNYWGVDALIVAVPLLAAWVAGMNVRLGGDRPPLGWWPALLWAGVMALAVVVLLVLPQPFYLLLFLPLLLAQAAPRLRRVGGLSVAVLAGVLLLGVVSAPYRLHRFMSALIPAIELDPYGTGYQASHIAWILKQLSWFGGDTLVHLPRATTQLLPISLAEQWGGLAFAGVFLLLGLWLVWTRPRKAGEDAVSEHRHVFTRFLWFFLVFAVVDNACVNLLLFMPHGPGMPIFSGNWGFLALAWLLMGANGQVPASPAWRKGLLLAGTALLAVALSSQLG